MRWFAALLLLSGSAFAASAPDAGRAPQPLTAERKLSASTVRLAEPFTYEIKVTHDPAQRYELLTPTNLGPFELIDQKRSRTDAVGAASTVFRLQMQLFELGKHRVPDLQFEIVDTRGTYPFYVPGSAIEAIGSLPDDAEAQGAELLDIRPPENIAVKSYRVLYGIGAALAAFALGYLIYRWVKQRRLRPALVAKPVDPLDVRTLRALRALQKEDLPAQGLTREYYFKLSDLMRTYLGERYGFYARESTTGELLTALQARRTPNLDLAEFSAFCNEVDLAKFARATTTPEECQRSYEYAVEVVTRTTPPPIPAAPPANARPV